MRYGHTLPRALLARHLRHQLPTAPLTWSIIAASQQTPCTLIPSHPSFAIFQTRSGSDRATHRRSRKDDELSVRRQFVGRKFVDFLYAKDLDGAIKTYPEALSDLTHDQQKQYIEWIKNSFNDEEIPKSTLSTAVNAIATALIEGKLEYDPSILEKLLHFFRRLHDHRGALSLWQWTRRTGKPLTLGVYSTIIQIVSDAPLKMSLAEIEKIYEEAIVDDGGSFAHYFLSQNAILGDRTSDSIAAQLHPRALHLLSAIARARLLNGNWQDGYLAYDSICRLSPERPKLFYQALISKDCNRPTPEVYRIVRAATLEGIELNPSSMGHMFSHIFNLVEPMTKRIENNAQLLVIMRVISSLLELAISQPQAKHIGSDVNKILTLLLYLTDRHRLPNAANNPSWQEYTLALATAGQDFLTDISPFLGENNQKAHIMVMKLAINAQNSEMFQTTLESMFKQDGSPNADVAQTLVEAAGRFGSLTEIKLAWNELVSLQREAQGQEDSNVVLGYWDLYALRSAISFISSEEALQFLLAECKKYSFPSLALLKHQDKNTPSPLDLLGAQSLIKHIFQNAHSTLNDIRPEESEAPTPPSIPKTSLTHQPLASPENMYLLYNELTTDPSPSTPSPVVPFADLPSEPILQRRFKDWSAVTSLLADADSYSRLTRVMTLKREPTTPQRPKKGKEVQEAASKAAKDAARLEGEIFQAFLLAGVDENLKTLDRLDAPPRFTDLDALREFVRRVRKMDGDGS